MAKRATTDSVAADMAPPKYREAVQTIRTVQAKKDKVAEQNGLIAGIWGKMEGYRVNRTAAKIFHNLDKKDPADRADIMRSLGGLIDAAGWENQADLVDRAENRVVPFPGGNKPQAADDDDDGTDDAGSGGDDAQDPPADAPKERISPAEARARKKAALAGSVTTGEPPAGDGEPFTGDNSDLAPE